ncbi:MAG TPA: DUF742 domain-containing protein [Nocardioidaceae bacterium]|nr:DUF742 domain-containing protein [Nocardioidaceae bacterium]
MAPEDARGPDDEPVAPARFVRPYTITAGRTKAAVDLPLEATLRIQPHDASTDADLGVGALRVLELCDRRSVAEVSALASMPIGVVRVLLGDLVQQGLVGVQATITESSSKDERIELIERTLRGLRSY